MSTAAVRRKPNDWCTINDFCLQSNGTAFCESVFGIGEHALQCYCAVQIPYEVPHEMDTTRAWILVYSEPISSVDEPMHADDLMFPFQLPLYPCKPLVFVALRATTNALHPPITLAWPCVQPVAWYTLNHTSFLLCMDEWHKAVQAKHIKTLLSASFDSFWELDEDCALNSLGEKDCFIEDVCEDTATISATVAAKQECALVTSKTNCTVISANESEEETSDDSDTEGNLSDDIFIADAGETEEEYEYPDEDEESDNDAETSSDDSAEIVDDT